MTSPHWFEEIRNPFTSQSFVDLIAEDGRGLLILHNGSQQWFFREGVVRNLLNMIDPWDGNRFQPDARTIYWLYPHGPMPDSERWRLGRELFGYASWGGSNVTIEGPARQYGRLGDNGDMTVIPRQFSFLRCVPASVAVTALYRESEDYSGRDLKNYAGRGMGYPYILRLVEFDGIACDAEFTLPGPIAKAYKTNLLGEPERELQPLPAEPPPGNSPQAAAMFEWQKVVVPMRPREIATLYLDVVPGRKQPRDLDAHREVWARSHRPSKVKS